MTMPVRTAQLHHERDNTRPYADGDHRVHHQVCTHTRFFDKDPSPEDGVGFLTHGVCLDCGATITLGGWKLTTHPHLPDEHLAIERRRYNELWGENLTR